jgi:hypothetical protein
MNTTAPPERVTITFSRSGQGVGHAAGRNRFPLCGTNANSVLAAPQIQAHDWSKVTCQRCLKAIANNDNVKG